MQAMNGGFSGSWRCRPLGPHLERYQKSHRLHVVNQLTIIVCPPQQVQKPHSRNTCLSTNPTGALVLKATLPWYSRYLLAFHILLQTPATSFSNLIQETLDACSTSSSISQKPHRLTYTKTISSIPSNPRKNELIFSNGDTYKRKTYLPRQFPSLSKKC